MPRSSRSRKTGWRSGQYHRSPDFRKLSLISFPRALVALVLAASLTPLRAQALLHIRIIEGDGAIHGAGVRSPRGLVVEVTDETGKPVDGAAVSFRLPEEGPGGTFVRGIRTEISMTTPDGRAAVRELLTGRTPGPFQIRVTAVKDQVRAGTVVDQYISEAPVRGTAPSANALVSTGGSKKWLIAAAIAGGVAAAGLAAGMSRRGGPSGPAPAAPAPIPPSIGAPSISIGKP